MERLTLLFSAMIPCLVMMPLRHAGASVVPNAMFKDVFSTWQSTILCTVLTCSDGLI